MDYNRALKVGITADDDGNRVGLYIPEQDRSTHVYMLGSSGVGKSKALATWILDDINNDRGCGVIDPHGDLVRDIVDNCPYREDVIIVDLTDVADGVIMTP